MQKVNILIVVFIITIFYSCKKNDNNAVQEKPEISELSNEIRDAVLFDVVKTFDNKENENVFILNELRLSYVSENGTFDFFSNNNKIKNINFENREYDGPGFIITLFESNRIASKKIVIIEATADVGTAWYYSIIVENNKVVNSFFIDEPRANSEIHSIEKFISIFSQNDNYIFRFDKNLIAKYSKVPTDYRNDSKYLYIEKYNTGDIQEESVSEITTDNPSSYKKSTEKEGLYTIESEKKCDINKDGLEDSILVFKNNKEFASDDDSSKKSPIVIFLNKGNNEYEKLENSNIFRNDSNDFFSQIVIKDNFLTVELNNEVPNEYIIEKYITFKYDKATKKIVLNKYGENVSGDKNENLLYTSKDFGLINYEDFNSNTISEIIK